MRSTNIFHAIIGALGYLGLASKAPLCQAFTARSRYSFATTPVSATTRLNIKAFREEHPPKDVLDKFDNHNENLPSQPKSGEEAPHSTPDQILAKFDDHFVPKKAAPSDDSPVEVKKETKNLSKKLLPWIPVIAATLAVGVTARTYNVELTRFPGNVLATTKPFAMIARTKLEALKTLVFDFSNNTWRKWMASPFYIAASNQIRSWAASIGCSPALLSSGLLIGGLAVTWGLARAFKPAPKQPVYAGAALYGFETNTPTNLLAKFDNHDCDSVAPKPSEEPHHPPKDILDKFDNHST